LRDPRGGGDTLSLRTGVGLAPAPPVSLYRRLSDEIEFINAIRSLTWALDASPDGG
jgi:hypothetical protein